MLLTEMETFYYFFLFRSYPKVAKQLHTSKANVRRKILKLEKELKFHLFAIYKKQIFFTEEGANFADYCKKMVKLGAEAYSYIESSKKHKLTTLNVYTTEKIFYDILSKKISLFKKLHPETALKIEFSPTSSIANNSQFDMYIFMGSKLHFPNTICEKIGTLENKKLFIVYRNVRFQPAKIINFLSFIQTHVFK